MTAPPDELDEIGESDAVVNADAEPVFSITTKGRRQVSDADRIGFEIDGEPFVFVRPKLSIAMGVAVLTETDTADLSALGADLVRIITSLLNYVERAPRDEETGALHGQALLEHRLTDPFDDLDVLDIAPTFQRMVAAGFGRNRPTVRPPASLAKRPKTGRASAAGSRGKRA